MFKDSFLRPEPNNDTMPAKSKLKGLRHQVTPAFEPCDLCAAKEEANGNFEKARRLYVNKGPSEID